MPVACNRREVVFERERCNPKIVIWHGGARALELHKDHGVVFRSLPARDEHGYGRRSQEALQQAFVGVPLGATVESSLDLGQTISGIQTSSHAPRRSANRASPRSRSMRRWVSTATLISIYPGQFSARPPGSHRTPRRDSIFPPDPKGPPASGRRWPLRLTWANLQAAFGFSSSRIIRRSVSSIFGALPSRYSRRAALMRVW
jgi:hypothetical protein